MLFLANFPAARLKACLLAALVVLVSACDAQTESDTGANVALGEDQPTSDASKKQANRQTSKSAQTEKKPPMTDQQKTDHKKYPPNKLAGETSPYLLLHAHNPVHWYPWGEESLAKAKKEGKIIFLSIGYSSCYWCHVMERESFTDEEIAAFLNKHFVCIKVDREERPDIDEIYMTSLHALGGRGGWPLSMFLTPDAKPFIGGTYYPPRDDPVRRMPGFLNVIRQINDAWTTRPDEVKKYAAELSSHVKKLLEIKPTAELSVLNREGLDKIQTALAEIYDEKHGGFAFSQTKFPNPSILKFMLRRAEQDKNEAARKMLLLTLDKMAQGGIFDHLGGGFHRYSVDPYWHIPHFEKMLYDNGQLTSVYAEAYRLTKREEYRHIIEGLLGFVMREMTDKQGGFYSALDAETDAHEGKFYIWEKKELSESLSKEELNLLLAVYSPDGKPNFEEKYFVLQLAESLAAIAGKRKEKLIDLQGRLSAIRAKLMEVRGKRKRPLTDIKILTGWNGMMIRGFSDAGRILKNKDYIDAATRAANFALENLRRKDGRLWRTMTSGKASLNAYLVDYALLVDGLIGLHQATGDHRWLTAATDITNKQIELFWDEKNSGFFFTSKDHEKLLARGKDLTDNVVPSGNSVTAANLIYLAQHAKEPAYLDRAQKTLQAIAGGWERQPTSAPLAAVSVANLLDIKGTDSLGKPVTKKPVAEEKSGDR